MAMYKEAHVKAGIKHLLYYYLKSFFIKKSSPETKRLREKEFICGVCHPTGNMEQMKAANIAWVRVDIPFPYEADGQLAERYLNFKKKALEYKKHGLKVMAVTPYPHSYSTLNIDVRTSEGKARVREIARFIICDMQGIADGLQITNEMGVPQFTMPLTMEEAASFIGINLEAMYDLRGDIIIGYNMACVPVDLNSRLKPYYKYCDYIGLDIYLGCFEDKKSRMWHNEAVLRALWAKTRKPILMMEFGYISEGESKSPEERNAILQAYGAADEEDAKQHIERFVDRLPERVKEMTIRVSEGDVSNYSDTLFHSFFTRHLYRELPKNTKIVGYPHTPDGQAKFFRDIIKRLYACDFVIGTIVYCYKDSETCYICGFGDCPVETRWGLVDMDENPKPSYYAVKEAFGRIQDNYNNKNN